MDASSASPAQSEPAALVDVNYVGHVYLGCSSRHVYRMADAGKMPAPLKIGALVRWRRAEIEKWIADGCKPVRSISAKGVTR